MTGYSSTVAAVNPDGTDITSRTVTTSVSNFPAVQPVNDNGGSLTVDGSVSVSNFPSTQNVAITGQPVGVTETAPAAADIRNGALTATGTLFTVPAGRTFRGSVSLSSTITVAGNGGCSVASANTGGGSGATTGTVHQLALQGLALTVAAVANTTTDVYIYGGTNGATVTFTQGAAGTQAAQANGRLL